MTDPLGGAREYRCCVRTTYVLRSLVSFLFLVSTSIIFHICLKVGSSRVMKVIVLLIGIKEIKIKNCRVKIVGIALTSYFRAFLRFFNVIPTSFALHICFKLFITIGNTVPQVTGLDPTTVFTLSPEVCITRKTMKMFLLMGSWVYYVSDNYTV